MKRYNLKIDLPWILLLAVASLFFMAATAKAAPSISTVTFSGNLVYGRPISITGSGYGTKPVQQQTYFFANFETSAAGVAGSTWGVTGTISSQNNLARKTDTCFEGGGCVGANAAMNLNDVNAGAVTIADVGVGGKFFVSVVWRFIGTGVTDSQNWKTYRWWPNGGTGKNNFYGGQQQDNSFVNATETDCGGGLTGITRAYSNDIEPDVGSHGQVQWFHKLNSAVDATDGEATIWEDGNRRINMTTWKSNTSCNSANGRYRTLFPIHMVHTGTGGFAADNNFRMDNIMIDTSWCAVFVTTVATFAQHHNKYWLPVQTWQSGSITAIFAHNGFSDGQTVYVYVRDNDGNVNSNGSAVKVASSGSGQVTPNITSVNPSSGTTAGGITARALGTDFLAGSTIVLGTITVSGVVVETSTSVRFTVPARASTGTVSITITSNTLTDTLDAAFAYVPSDPVLTSVTPNTGLTTGGDLVELIGERFQAGMEVTFGGTNATNETVVFSTYALCIVPQFNSAEAVNVTVTNPDGDTDTLTNGYTYTTPSNPTIRYLQGFRP